MTDPGPLVAVRAAGEGPADRVPAGRRPGAHGPVLARVALVATAVVVGLIVWSSGPPDAGGQRGLQVYLNHEHVHGLPRWITFGLIEALANVLLFIPLGYFGALALRRWGIVVVPAAAAASAVIELGQRLFLPERVASVQDVLMNTLGASIGFVIATPWLLRRRRRRLRSAGGRRGARD